MQNKQLDVTLRFIHVAFMFELELFQNQMWNHFRSQW